MKRIIVACVAGLLFVGCRTKDYDKNDRKIGDRRDVPAVYDRDTQVAMTDPVCGMCVEPTAALTQDHEGTTYPFCSEECLCAFQQNPAAYAQGVLMEDEVD